MYRVNRLGWAEKWAKDTGRVGARYPWQTASSGKVASHANEAEIHIVGDVALSMWQYVGLLYCSKPLSFEVWWRSTRTGITARKHLRRTSRMGVSVN
jgi:hypothetical protein